MYRVEVNVRRLLGLLEYLVVNGALLATQLQFVRDDRLLGQRNLKT